MDIKRDSDGGIRKQKDPWQIESVSVREQVLHKIREAILSGDLPIGAQLVENELAQRLGVSRAPIREVLHQLPSEGLVDHVARIGRFVHIPTVEEVHEVQEIRGMLEGLAARKLAQRLTEDGEQDRIDELEFLVDEGEKALGKEDHANYYRTSREFHEKLVQFTELDTLKALHQFIMNRAALFRQLSEGIASRQQQAVAEHTAIVDAIRNGDEDRADQVTREHAIHGMLAIQKAIGKIIEN